MRETKLLHWVGIQTSTFSTLSFLFEYKKSKPGFCTFFKWENNVKIHINTNKKKYTNQLQEQNRISVYLTAKLYVMYIMHTTNTVSIEVLDLMYSDGYGSTPATLCMTHMHTTYPPDIVNAQNEYKWYFWVTYSQRDPLLRRFSYFCTKCTTHSVLCSAAPCCSFWRLQLSSPHIHKLSATFSMHKVWNYKKKFYFGASNLS